VGYRLVMQLPPRNEVPIWFGKIAGSWLGSATRGADHGHIGEKPVAAARNRFDEARTLDRVAQHLTNLTDGLVEAMIEIHDALRPQPTLQLGPGQQPTRLLQKHGEDPEGLFLQSQPRATFSEFAGPKINLKDAKPQTSGSVTFPHGNLQPDSLPLPNVRADTSGGWVVRPLL
jgi:hypothetical protein